MNPQRCLGFQGRLGDEASAGMAFGGVDSAVDAIFYYYVVHTNALISPHYLRGATAISERSRRDIGDPRGRLQQNKEPFISTTATGHRGKLKRNQALTGCQAAGLERDGRCGGIWREG